MFGIQSIEQISCEEREMIILYYFFPSIGYVGTELSVLFGVNFIRSVHCHSVPIYIGQTTETLSQQSVLLAQFCV